jgi:hypothetical protein
MLAILSPAHTILLDTCANEHISVLCVVGVLWVDGGCVMGVWWVYGGCMVHGK